MALERVQCWRTSDGALHTDEIDAKRHEGEVEFRKWCEKEICIGGEWNSRMVADRVLEDWWVVPKVKVVPSDPYELHDIL